MSENLPITAPLAPNEIELIELKSKGKIEVAPGIWMSKARGEDGKRAMSFYGPVYDRVAKMMAAGEDWQSYIRDEVHGWNTGLMDGLDDDILDELLEDGYVRIEKDFWVCYDDGGSDVRALNELCDELEKAQESGKGEEWVMERLRRNEERNELVAAFLNASELRQFDGEQQVGPNGRCPCGSGRKFKKCCQYRGK